MGNVYTQLTEKKNQARRIVSQIAIDVYAVVLAECQRQDKYDDQFCLAYIQKVIDANNVCLQQRDDVKLRRENELLKEFIPELTLQKISEIMQGVALPDHKGKATGVVVKALKDKGYVPNIELVNQFLKGEKSETQ